MLEFGVYEVESRVVDGIEDRVLYIPIGSAFCHEKRLREACYIPEKY